MGENIGRGGTTTWRGEEQCGRRRRVGGKLRGKQGLKKRKKKWIEEDGRGRIARTMSATCRFLLSPPFLFLHFLPSGLPFGSEKKKNNREKKRASKLHRAPGNMLFYAEEVCLIFKQSGVCLVCTIVVLCLFYSLGCVWYRSTFEVFQ